MVVPKGRNLAALRTLTEMAGLLWLRVAGTAATNARTIQDKAEARPRKALKALEALEDVQEGVVASPAMVSIVLLTKTFLMGYVQVLDARMSTPARAMEAAQPPGRLAGARVQVCMTKQDEVAPLAADPP